MGRVISVVVAGSSKVVGVIPAFPASAVGAKERSNICGIPVKLTYRYGETIEVQVSSFRDAQALPGVRLSQREPSEDTLLML